MTKLEKLKNKMDNSVECAVEASAVEKKSIAASKDANILASSAIEVYVEYKNKIKMH